MERYKKISGVGDGETLGSKMRIEDYGKFTKLYFIDGSVAIYRGYHQDLVIGERYVKDDGILEELSSFRMYSHSWVGWKVSENTGPIIINLRGII